MAQLSEFHIQNVRCIRSEQRVPIRPVTLLVGENSTGKTSFLGCYQVSHNMFRSSQFRTSARPDFNEAPFLLGSFRDIASWGSNSHEFKLGAKLQFDRNGAACDVGFCFSSSESEPIVSQVSFNFGSEKALRLTFGSHEKQALGITGPDITLNVDGPRFFGPHPNNILDAVYYLDRLVAFGESEETLFEDNNYQRLREYVKKHFPQQKHANRLGDFRPRIHTNIFTLSSYVAGVAPIRSSPKRTYDKYTEESTKFGENLQRLLETKKSRASPATKLFFKFGKESQMYSNVKVQWTGRVITEPYKVLVKARGRMTNIMHVGYGVSQVLPIVAEVCATEPKTLFLLQQPEVHLHPRGEAALASFLVDAANILGHSFIVETHSDYILDRLKIKIRRGNLKPEDFSLLFFAPTRSNVDIQHIDIDTSGDLINPSKKYRSFFTEETLELLGFDE